MPRSRGGGGQPSHARTALHAYRRGSACSGYKMISGTPFKKLHRTGDAAPSRPSGLSRCPVEGRRAWTTGTARPLVSSLTGKEGKTPVASHLGQSFLVGRGRDLPGVLGHNTSKRRLGGKPSPPLGPTPRPPTPPPSDAPIPAPHGPNGSEMPRHISRSSPERWIHRHPRIKRKVISEDILSAILEPPSPCYGHGKGEVEKRQLPRPAGPFAPPPLPTTAHRQGRTRGQATGNLLPWIFQVQASPPKGVRKDIVSNLENEMTPGCVYDTLSGHAITPTSTAHGRVGQACRPKL